MSIINIQDETGDTPLHNACYGGYLRIVKILCQKPEIDLTIRNNDGKTPIEEAQENILEWAQLLRID